MNLRNLFSLEDNEDGIYQTHGKRSRESTLPLHSPLFKLNVHSVPSPLSENWICIASSWEQHFRPPSLSTPEYDKTFLFIHLRGKYEIKFSLLLKHVYELEVGKIESKNEN